jgi:DNA-binding response OmpR family regulator
MLGRIPVLYIDDDQNLRKLVEYNLRLGGFKVYLAGDGPTGIKIACKHKPKVILLDVLMPEMDGLEVLSELKYNRKTSKIPVFMLTSKQKLDDIERAFEVGADDYITKPFDPTKIAGLVKEKLNKLLTVE